MIMDSTLVSCHVLMQGTTPTLGEVMKVQLFSLKKLQQHVLCEHAAQNLLIGSLVYANNDDPSSQPCLKEIGIDIYQCRDCCLSTTNFYEIFFIGKNELVKHLR